MTQDQKAKLLYLLKQIDTEGIKSKLARELQRFDNDMDFDPFTDIKILIKVAKEHLMTRQLNKYEIEYKRLFERRKEELLNRHTDEELATRQANIYAVRRLRRR